MRVNLIAILLLLASLAPAIAADLVGRASIIDGDTIEIHGRRVRLFGIDAPESRQLCEVDGKPYRCGQQAALALADEIGQRTVWCEQREVDRYGRMVAVCSAGGEDLGRWMVRQGWALAYRRYSRGGSSSREPRDLARHIPGSMGLAAGALIPDLDIWRAAAAMVKRFGADAAVQAALRADELFEAGDEQGTATWRAIVRAIGELQRQQPRAGERVQ
jgi:hypothetical protein